MLNQIFKKEKETLPYLLIITLIMLSFVSYTRFTKQETFIDTETYHHLTASDGSSKTNELSVSNTPNYLSLTDYLTKFFKKNIFLWTLPVLIGVFSVFLIYRLLETMNFDYLEKNISLIILILSPSFVKTFTSFTSMTWVLPLFFAFLYLFFNDMKLFAYPLVLLISFIYYPAGLALFLFLMVQLLFKPEKKESIRIGILGVILLVMYFTLYNFVPISNFSLSSPDMLVAELGNYYSLSTFAILLALIGAFSKKMNSQKRSLLLIWILIFGFFSLIFPNLMHLMVLAVVILAAEGTLIVYNHEWELNMLKNLTIMLIIYGLLFSYLSTSNNLVYQTPGKEIKHALEIAKEMKLQSGVVLSAQENGFLIQHELGFPTMLDEYSDYPLDRSNLINDSKIIFYSRNMEQTKNYLNKYGIKYIVITKKMREGQTWSKPDQGLLFLLLNSENFKSILDYQDVEIWEYKG